MGYEVQDEIMEVHISFPFIDGVQEETSGLTLQLVEVVKCQKYLV